MTVSCDTVVDALSEGRPLGASERDPADGCAACRLLIPEEYSPARLVFGPGHVPPLRASCLATRPRPCLPRSARLTAGAPARAGSGVACGGVCSVGGPCTGGGAAGPAAANLSLISSGGVRCAYMHLDRTGGRSLGRRNGAEENCRVHGAAAAAAARWERW